MLVFFLAFHYLFSLIVTAFTASLMRRFVILAIGADSGRYGRQKIMRTTFTGA
jgi:hypothetical protein